MKRGELSMEVIIIAAIALLVLVILTVLILRSGGGLNEGTQCTSIESGGVSAYCTEQDNSCDSGFIPSRNACDGEGMKCCIPIGGSQE